MLPKIFLCNLFATLTHYTCIVIGICHGLPVGDIDISLTTQAVDNNVQFYIRYATGASRMYVEEIKQETRTEGILNIKHLYE